MFEKNHVKDKMVTRLDHLIFQFRQMKVKYGMVVEAEIKANYEYHHKIAIDYEKGLEKFNH